MKSSALILFVALPVALQAASPELLQNGDFEAGLQGWMTPRFEGEGGASVVTDAAGGHLLRLEVSKPDIVSGTGERSMVNPVKIVQVIEPAPVAEVALLAATVAMGEFQGMAEVRVEMVAAPRGETILSRSLPIGADTKPGTRMSVRCYVPGGTAKIRLSIELTGTGRILVDDLSVTHQPLSPLAAGRNALDNAGFENGLDSWQLVGKDAGIGFQAAKAAAHSGNFGCRVREPEKKRRRALLPNIGQEIITGDLSGREILIDGWLRPQGLEGKGYLAAYFYGMSEKGPYQRFVRFDEVSVSGTGPYRHLSKRIAVRGPMIYGVVVRAVLDGSGSLDVDDLGFAILPRRDGSPRGAILASSLIVLLLFAAAAFIGRRRRAQGARTE